MTTHSAPTCTSRTVLGFRFRIVSQFGQWSVVTQRTRADKPFGRDFQIAKYDNEAEALADYTSRR